MPQPARSSKRNPGTSTRYITTLPPMGVRVTRTASLESINCPLTLPDRFAQSGATGIRRWRVRTALRRVPVGLVAGSQCADSPSIPVPCIPAMIPQPNRDRSWAESQILQRVQRPAPPEDFGPAMAVSGATSALGSPRSDRWILTHICPNCRMPYNRPISFLCGLPRTGLRCSPRCHPRNPALDVGAICLVLCTKRTLQSRLFIGNDEQVEGQPE